MHIVSADTNQIAICLADKYNTRSSVIGAYWLILGYQTQWGLASTKTGRNPAPFPIAFPNAIFSVVAVSNYTSFAISQLTLTGFNTSIGSDTGAGLLWWIAVGRQQWGKIIADATELVFPVPYTGLNYIVLATSSDYYPLGGVNWIANPIDQTKVNLSRTNSNGAANIANWPAASQVCWLSLGY